MISESSVRKRLSDLLQGQSSLEEFENWLAAESWNMHRDSSADAIELVSSIHLLLSERDDRILSEPALRKELQSLLENVFAHYEIVITFVAGVNPQPRTLMTATSSPVFRQLAVQLS